MIKKIIICSFLAIALLGCDDDKDNTHSKYAGVWYRAESDSFTKILNNGDVIPYECTLNGYTKMDVEEYSSKVIGDNVIWNYLSESGTATLEIQGDMLISSEEGEEPMSMKKFDSIPDTCEGNAIEISYISTTEVNEGEDTTFTIDFNYRLADPEAVIEVGFTSNIDGTATFTDQGLLDIFEQAGGSSSVTVNHVPALLGDAVPYYLYIFMRPKAVDGLSLPIVSDKVLITIHANI